ncbi:MAG: zf-HC2 domain-containing protein [Dehalococcoidaceae bacterium]|nr:zf-HC2 domain-containing protein [Dehalococcoidaceae bacterium]
MNCNEIRLLIPAFLDAEVSENERKIIQDHISFCNSCRRETLELASVQEKLKKAFQTAAEDCLVPDDRWNQLLRQISSQSRVPAMDKNRTGLLGGIRAKKRWKVGLAGTAAAILVLAAVLVPTLLGPNEEVLAIEIALKDPEVLAMLEQYEIDPKNLGDESAFYIDDASKLVIEVKPGVWIVVDVDTGHKEVASVKVESLSGITEQDILELAATDSAIKQIIEAGARVEEIHTSLFYPSSLHIYNEYPFSKLDFDPQEMLGLVSGVSLTYQKEYYTVFVNHTLGKVALVIKPGDIQITYSQSTTTVTRTVPSRENGE